MTVHKASIAFVAQGSVADYGADERAALALRFAQISGVDVSEIEISVEAASVRVTALIAAPSAEAASALSAPITSALADPSAASAALGIAVTSSPTVSTVTVRSTLDAPPQSPPKLRPPPPPITLSLSAPSSSEEDLSASFLGEDVAAALTTKQQPAGQGEAEEEGRLVARTWLSVGVAIGLSVLVLVSMLLLLRRRRERKHLRGQSGRFELRRVRGKQLQGQTQQQLKLKKAQSPKLVAVDGLDSPSAHSVAAVTSLPLFELEQVILRPGGRRLSKEQLPSNEQLHSKERPAEAPAASSASVTADASNDSMQGAWRVVSEREDSLSWSPPPPLQVGVPRRSTADRLIDEGILASSALIERLEAEAAQARRDAADAQIQAASAKRIVVRVDGLMDATLYSV